jgi:cellulose synthase/poly-beta-1,6-N-acetylglucosamine synthase-like glycosyltransferase
MRRARAMTGKGSASRARSLRLVVLAIITFVAIVSFTQRSAPAIESAQANSAGVSSDSPQPPREVMEIAAVPSAVRRVPVPAGGNLQRALDEARPGDQIELAAGAVYEGPFRLPRKPGPGWIVVTSSGPLPAPGERVRPEHAVGMAKLRASSSPVVGADPGAHHYRFVGVEIAPSPGATITTLVQLGDKERALNELAHDIIFDRCYLHGDPARGARRGIALNARRAAVVESYLADFKEVGADSQAIAGWNGPGPFTIANNYLEAAGENVMFGGEDPAIHGLVPADIRLTRNHLAKPLRWRQGHPDYEGTAWAVKNLFELKNARRVVVDGNLFEHNWPDAQNGFAILFTVRNQSGGAPWSVVEDVTFTNNVVRRAGAGINILGRDDIHDSQPTQRVEIAGNLFEQIGGGWGSGRLFQLLDGTRHVHIRHNTAFHSGFAVFGGDHDPHAGFVFENNIVQHNDTGILGSGTSSGRASLDRYFPGAMVRRNVLVGANPALYPHDNYFPETLAAAGFVAARDGAHRPSGARRYAAAGSDGRDVGADLESLSRVIAQVSSPTAARAEAPVASDRVFGRRAVPADRPALVVLFWSSLLLIGYTYAGYPLIAWLRARLRPHPAARAPIEPTVTIIVVAHNEESCIEARIENLLALDYPAERRQILVGSDGSTDETVARARRFAHDGVQVVPFRQWRGKTAVLNQLILRARGEIVLLADARQRFEPQVVRRLVARFADPSVGAVSGELMLTDSTGTPIGRGASFYWRYEKFIRVHEGRAGSTVGATGAIYAIRRALFKPIPNDTILDDVLIPMRIVQQGYSVQFEQEARAFQEVSRTSQQEYVRKLRTIAGAFQLFAREWWLLNPWRNHLWFETLSHKGLRLLLPALHTVLFAANLGLSGAPFYGVIFAAQTAFYAAAIAGHERRYAARRPLAISVPYAMCFMLWATLVAFHRFVTDRQHVTWEQAPAFDLPRTSTR